MSDQPMSRWIVEISDDGDEWLPMAHVVVDFAEVDRIYAQLVAGCGPKTRLRLLRLDAVIEQEAFGRGPK